MSDCICCDPTLGILACPSFSFCCNGHDACSYCSKKKRVEDLILEIESEVVQNQPRRRDPMTVDGGPGVTADGAQQQWRDQNHTG